MSEEASEMAKRSVQFDMNELARLAAESVNAKACISILKCPDGLYNRSFILTMENGKEIIGKVPNTNAGAPHLTTASELATMDFVRTPIV